MKKLFAILTAMIMMLPALGAADCGCGCGACACGTEATGVLVARSETIIQTNVFCGASWWALTEGNRVFGKISPLEQVGTVPANPPRAAWIGGAMDNGLVRDHHTMTVIGEGFGLTSIDVRIELRRDALELVESIVRDRLAVDTITANAIIAATMWWEQGTVCHVFFLPGTAAWVGTITAGRATIDLYAGDWGGVLALGFVTGSSPAPTPTPEPHPTPAPRTETRTEYTMKKTCVKNVYITNVVQINIAGKATQVVDVGKPCVKPCLPECLK